MGDSYLSRMMLAGLRIPILAGVMLRQLEEGFSLAGDSGR
jgi:hypothetical protein